MSDPYNHDGPAAKSAVVFMQLERAWKACVESKTPAPDLLLVPSWFPARLKLLLDTPAHLVGSENWYYV